ncbi:uncharacterized protein LOC108244638 isoform X2 [Kryptolebias marmoratus]|uniref:uncharacterized protein LOC108244638 isoform X2 n=1 Tax=Kryptolebias marmoratus TaxID=37003 RepID=UPI000D52F1DB|nr:uncharacterized protein LOC108244638 isoform X2 [Kryptolebias marmoratus]
MAHLTYLTLLLGTIQLLFIPAASSQEKFSITVQDCPQKWIIRERDEKVLFLRCRKLWWNNSFKLIIRVLPWSCQWNYGVNRCLEIKITTYGSSVEKRVEKMCKRCCTTLSSCPRPSCDSSVCKERLEISMTSGGISAVNLWFPDLQDITVSTDNETGSLLQFYNEPKSWIEALNSCLNDKSSLVQNMTQTGLDEVKDLLEDDGVWVGLERSIFGTDPEWKWISGSKAENLQWNSRFPVDRFNNHCGKMILVNEEKQIQFLDASCHEELPYICEGPV